MKRGKLRVAGKSDTATVKREIQALLREYAIARDGGCVLKDKGAGVCAGPLQAEHLVSRANSASFGDMRNIICLCQRHHIFWKPQNSRLYWELVEEIIGPERWAWIKRVEADKRPYKMDWCLIKVALEQEVRKLKENADS